MMRPPFDAEALWQIEIAYYASIWLLAMIIIVVIVVAVDISRRCGYLLPALGVVAAAALALAVHLLGKG